MLPIQVVFKLLLLLLAVMVFNTISSAVRFVIAFITRSSRLLDDSSSGWHDGLTEHSVGTQAALVASSLIANASEDLARRQQEQQQQPELHASALDQFLRAHQKHQEQQEQYWRSIILPQFLFIQADVSAEHWPGHDASLNAPSPAYGQASDMLRGVQSSPTSITSMGKCKVRSMVDRSRRVIGDTTDSVSGIVNFESSCFFWFETYATIRFAGL